jgi:hypothetical protein
MSAANLPGLTAELVPDGTQNPPRKRKGITHETDIFCSSWLGSSCLDFYRSQLRTDARHRPPFTRCSERRADHWKVGTMQEQQVKIVIETREQLALFVACLGKWGSFITACLMENERNKNNER